MNESDSRAIAVLDSTSQMTHKIVGAFSILSLLFTIEPLVAVILLLSSVVTMLCNIQGNKVNFRHRKEANSLWRKKDYINRVYHLADYSKELRIGKADDLLLKEYDQKEDFKVLLCHYPHYYESILKNSQFDLILSGHAHGGQWRFLGRGVYAPHQGIFPKYTSGLHDGRHIISRGCVNNARPIPRLFNPCEILEVTIVSE